MRFVPILFFTLSALHLAGCAGGGVPRLRGALLSAGDLAGKDRSASAAESFKRLKKDGYNSVVVALTDDTAGKDLDGWRSLATSASLALYLWIEVGRSQKLADLHPEWISGMGSHEDWRLRFPQAPRPGTSQRIGMYPWVPIWYRAVLEERRKAIVSLLDGRTEGIAGVFLDKVQGAPSACGCGNDQCRWTADYNMGGGPEKVDGSPSAELVALLKKDLPGVEWIPVWVIECEEHDHGKGSTEYCASVDCFHGRCWKESTKELEALRNAQGPGGALALLSAAKLFRRDLPRYAPAGGWLGESLKDLSTLPPKYGHPPVSPDRVISIVEDAAGDEAAFEEKTLATGVKGLVVLKSRIDEGWEPRLIPAASGAPSKALPAKDHQHD
jgi:hypothetical protein